MVRGADGANLQRGSELRGIDSQSVVLQYTLAPCRARTYSYDRQSNVSALAMAPSAPVTTYQGCYADEGTRALPVQLMSSGATASTCAAAALAQGLKYAGLQYYGY